MKWAVKEEEDKGVHGVQVRKKALSNAERQARHRERVKDKLRNVANPVSLRNDFLDRMRDAFIASDRQGRLDALQGISDRPLLPDDSGWNKWARDALQAFDEKIENITEERLIDLISSSARKMGNRLVMETYRGFLSEEVERQKPVAPPKKQKNNRVT